MATLLSKCPSCDQKFKTIYTLKKHAIKKHGEFQESRPVFIDLTGKAPALPLPQKIQDSQHESYCTWLAGLTERIVSTYHPILPGKWVRIELQQVLKIYFEHLLWKLDVHANSVRDMAHKAQPVYTKCTRKISYKLFDIEQFWNALEEQSTVPFNDEALFAGNQEIADPTVAMSAEQEIAYAKEKAKKPIQERKRPSSKSMLIVGLGEGKATREIELIWWPNLYSFTNHGRLVIRMYIKKCEF